MSITEILKELEFRSGEVINLSSPRQIAILSEILDKTIYRSIKQEFITNILEGPKDGDNATDSKDVQKQEKKDDGYTSIGGAFYVKNADAEKRDGLKGGFKAKTDDSQRYVKDKDTGKYVVTHEKEQPEDDESGITPKNLEKSKEGGEDEPDEQAVADAEAQANIKKTFSDKSYQDGIKSQEDAAKKDKIKKQPDSDNETELHISEQPDPEIGKLGDTEDTHSDGKIKQKGLTTGYRETRGFKPAPGNAGSMLAEIMSGETFFHLDSNPYLSVKELADKMYEQVKDTRLGKQNGDYTKSTNSSGDYAGKNKQLMLKLESIAASGRKKWERTGLGIQNLVDKGVFSSNQVTSRNFYGHIQSIRKQVELINSAKGKIYTREGVEVPKNEIIDLIQKSGKGENPSDTSTITMDEKGNTMVEFHSDKLSTADIQANSTPNKESENAKKLVKKLKGLSGQIKEQTLQVLNEGQKRLKVKEQELKTAGSEPARIIKDMKMSDVMKKIKRGKNSKMMKSIIDNVLYKHKQAHPFLKEYLAAPESGDKYSTEELLQGYLDAYSDLENESEPTGVQIQFMSYLGERHGIDISENLSNIRMDSIEIQRDTHKKLNERSFLLPNGESKPLGDYLESQNIIEKLHLGVIDGKKGKGVAKYDGLFNLNMGGTIVESKQLKECLGIDSTDDFVHNFSLGNPEDGETITKNTSTGSVTGRNVFVYATTKNGKRIPFAFKTNRSKQGQTGTLNTTYQYHPKVQKCFKNNQ